MASPVPAFAFAFSTADLRAAGRGLPRGLDRIDLLELVKRVRQ